MMMVGKKEMWTNRGDAWEHQETHSTIRLTNPRGGFRLYARRDPGTKRPEWYESLREAKAGVEDVMPAGGRRVR